MLTRNRLYILLGLALAVAAVVFKTPLASSQGLTITAAAVTDELPVTSPQSDLWSQTTAVEVPLSAQMVTRPMQPETNIKAVTVRALHNEQEVALLLEWADSTRNESTLRVEDFRDGVAVQFPLVEAQPYFCMGQQGGDVNIWHWKADWQAAINADQELRDVYPNMYVDRYPFTEEGSDVLAAAYTDPTFLTAQAAGNLAAASDYASPVENLVAGGFGGLTSQPRDRQNVQGYGEWEDGVWRVVFSRSLTSDQNENISLTPDQVYSIAFAAWDGANQERNGTKSTSQWVSLQLAGTGAAAPAPAQEATPGGGFRIPLWFWISMGVLMLFIATGTVVYFSLGD